MPSMSSGDATPLFEPIHGSAPSLAGRDLANPVGAILCAAMLLREAFSLPEEAAWIESALDSVLSAGYRTPDLATPYTVTVGCSGFSAQLRARLREPLPQLERYGWGV